MRRFATVLLLSSLAFPGFAFAQSAAPSAVPPAPPQGAPPPGDCMPPPGGPPGPGMPPPGDWKHGQAMMQKMQAKFNAANTTHDGHLTLAQAQAANLKPVVDHFAEIDVKHRGYVTFNEIQAWRLDDMAQHMEQQAAALRAED